MKHFTILLLLVVCGYVAYQITPADARSAGLSFLARHALKLGGLVLVLLLLLAAAVRFPASTIF